MRPIIIALFAGALSSLNLAPALAADEPPAHLEHPGAVALSQGPTGEWVYKSFPRLMPLYVFGGDEPGTSNCDQVCILVWPIIRADENDEALGDWTVIDREHGNRQWLYQGRPVYMFYNDTPGNPRGIGLREGWYYEKEEDRLRRARPGDDKKTIWYPLEP